MAGSYMFHKDACGNYTTKHSEHTLDLGFSRRYYELLCRDVVCTYIINVDELTRLNRCSLAWQNLVCICTVKTLSTAWVVWASVPIGPNQASSKLIAEIFVVRRREVEPRRHEVVRVSQ